MYFVTKYRHYESPTIANVSSSPVFWRKIFNALDVCCGRFCDSQFENSTASKYRYPQLLWNRWSQDDKNNLWPIARNFNLLVIFDSIHCTLRWVDQKNDYLYTFYTWGSLQNIPGSQWSVITELVDLTLPSLSPSASWIISTASCLVSHVMTNVRSAALMYPSSSWVRKREGSWFSLTSWNYWCNACVEYGDICAINKKRRIQLIC